MIGHTHESGCVFVWMPACLYDARARESGVKCSFFFFFFCIFDLSFSFSILLFCHLNLSFSWFAFCFAKSEQQTRYIHTK